MTYKGVAKGKIIELEQPLPYRDGQPVNVLIEPSAEQFCRGSSASILQAMAEPPHLESQDVDELERAIENAALQVRTEGVFDGGQ